jgi:sporulation protein YlmC with PRC-barrel domain
MPETTQLTLGAEATCSDGVCGEVDRIIVDPDTKAVTHIVVEPKNGRVVGRLVPINLIEATAGDIRLRCSAAELEDLAIADEEHPQAPPESQPWEQQMITGVPDPQYEGLHEFAVPKPPAPIAYDLVPLGAIEVRRNSQVVAEDGDVGQLEALVVEPDSNKVTHLLLQKGHHWGHKQVPIPISAVSFFDDDGTGIQLKISKQEVQDLPELDGR